MEAEIHHLRSELRNLKDKFKSLLRKEIKAAVHSYKKQADKPLKERKTLTATRQGKKSPTVYKPGPARSKVPKTRGNTKSLNVKPIKSRKRRVTGSASMPVTKKRRLAHYTCDICEEEFNNLMNYNKHLVGHEMTSNSDFGGFSCPLCDKKFESLPSMFIHQTWHAKSDDVSCTMCNGVFERMDDLTIHHHVKHYPISSGLMKMLKSAIVRRQKNIDNGKHIPADHKCDYCPQQFSNVRLYSEHTLEHLIEDNNCPSITFKCPLCESQFSKLWGVFTHLLYHPNERVDCPKCNENYEDTNALLIHFYQTHCDAPKQISDFVVRIFSYTLENPRNAKRRKSNRTPQKCTLCFATFLNESSYEKHDCNSGEAQKKKPVSEKKRDSGSRLVNYKCTICTEEFNNLMTYNKHIVSHEMTSNTDLVGFSCPLCDKKFDSLPSLFIHQSWHAKTDDIVCLQCNGVFDKMDDLIIHHHKKHHPIPSSLMKMLKSAIARRQKNKAKGKHIPADHKCDFCDERFANIRLHTEHTLKHMAEQNGCPMVSFDCPLCENKFSKIWGVFSHMMFHPSVGSSCLKCNEPFEDNNSLLIHYYKMHFEAPEQIAKFVLGIICKSQDNAKNAKRRVSNRMPYKCESCSASFVNEAMYKKHVCKSEIRVSRTVITSVSNGNSEKMDILNGILAETTTTESKSEEMSVYVKSKVIYDCTVCSEKFYQKMQYAKHILEFHPNSNELKEKFCCNCTLCGSSFSSQSQLGVHHLTHGIIRQCPICKENFSSNELFVTHINESHPGTSGEKFIEYADGCVCQICGVSRDDRYKMIKHIQVVHSEKKFVCDICGMGFAFKKYLNNHTVRVHNSNENIFVCDECGKQFKRRNLLKNHINKVHVNKKERIPCKQCGETFSCMETYQTHYIAIHTNEKPFKCNVCQKTFSTYVSLHSHKTIMCEKDKAKISKCPICGETFENYIVMAHHKSNVHKYGCDEEDVCNVCDKKFKNAHNLYVHNRAYHTGEKGRTVVDSKYICNVCEKPRANKKLLFNHWLTHRPENSFECEICNVSFKQSTKSIRHKHKQHKDLKNFKMKTHRLIYKQLKKCFETEKPYTQVSEDGPIVDTGYLYSPEQTITNSMDGVYFNTPNDGGNHSDGYMNDILNNFGNPGVINNDVSHPLNHQLNSSSATPSYIDFSRANVPVCTESRPAISEKLPVDDIDETTKKPSSGDLQLANSTAFEEPATFSGYAENDDYFSDVGGSPMDYHDTPEDNNFTTTEKKPLILNKNVFPEDPFPKKLVLSLPRLKKYTCYICNVELYTKKLYKKHRNSRTHRNLKRDKMEKNTSSTVIKDELDSEEEEKSVRRRRKKSKSSGKKSSVKKIVKPVTAVAGEALFTCPYCDEKFDVMTHFRKHVIIHKMNKSCLLCKEKFASGASLAKHYIKDHNGQMVEYCTICQKGYLQYSDGLRKHMQVIHGDPNQQKKGLLPSQKLKYTCDFCGERFTTNPVFQAHLISHNKDEYKCIHCTEVFKISGELETHYNEVHNGEMPFKCNECPQSFCTKARLTLHKKEKHPFLLERDPVDMKFACDTCGVRMSIKQSMINHRLTHATAEERLKTKLFCEICGNSFTQLHSLIVHRRIHTGERPFKCDQCEMAFISKILLSEHIKGIHEKSITCHICGKSLKRQRRLAEHLKSHELARPRAKRSRSSGGNFPCTICFKILPTMTQLLKHKRKVHTEKGSGPVFTCEVCSIEFYEEQALIKHSRLHDPNRPFQCDMCTHRFNHITNLNYHKKKVHGYRRKSNLQHELM